MKYDLSKQNKLLPKNKMKLHVVLRRYVDEKKFGLLAQTFSIGENYPFWKLLIDNFYNSIYLVHYKIANQYYDDVQEWYHQWHLQDYNKNEWLHFYKGWQPDKTEFDEFWEELPKLPDVRTFNLAEMFLVSEGRE